MPENFGIFATAMSVVELFFILGGLGISLACVNLHTEEPDVMHTGFILSTMLSSGIFLLSVGAAALLRAHYDDETVIIILILSGLKSLVILSTISLAVIEIEHRFKTSAYLTGVGRPLGVLTAIAMAHFGFGTWSLVAREALAIVIMVVFSVVLSPYRPRLVFNPAIAKRIMHFAWGVFFQRMTDTIYMRLPVFLLAMLGNPTLVGYYERTLYLSTMSNSILAQVYGKVGFTIFSKVKAKPEKIVAGLEWNLFFITRLSFGAGLLVALFPQTILVGLLGEQWREGAKLFQGFALFIALFPMIEVLKVGLMAFGITSLVTLPRIGAILCALVGVAVGWRTGIWAAVSWAMSAGMIVMVSWLVVGSRSYGLNLRIIQPAALPMALALLLATALLILNLEETVRGLALTLFVWTLVVPVLGFPRMLKFYRLVKSA